LPVNVVRAVALKFAVAAPAAKVIDAGTVTEVLLLASVTAAPPAGAACVRLTVQLLTPPGVKWVGEHVTGSKPYDVICPPPADVTIEPLPSGSVAYKFEI
jgi:hypothetical protein